MRRFLFVISCLALIASSVIAEDTKITFVTDWKAQAEHGGFYQAVAKGYYKKRGLDVTIRQGGPQSDNPRLLAAGAIDIALTSNNFQPINLLAAGADTKVVMAVFQKDPQVFMVHPENPANSIAEMKDMPIFIADSAIGTIWPWLEAKFGFTDKQIRKYTYSLAPWLVNKGTVQEGYLSSEPFTAKQAGIDPKVFLLADEGYLGYAAMVTVRGEFIRKSPEVVRKFVEATIEGWQDYLYNDPVPANALILNDNPEATEELLAYSIKTMKSANIVGTGGDIGQIDPARWNRFYREMSALGVFPSNLDVRKAFTTEFLPSSVKTDTKTE
ncbi:ABC transporter substrate-binding protein [Kordiimonas sp. SCSIO 12610]|uniref:ABC transporter substrate-binding protein n=1 Tax=Kordiimonas sp. SCSIO 12610 TaxID=2829597 RepID=UPI00210DFFDC|nr:ABC transporter substrate-binding protein [Kordiimonas sp. SCSIO 12610]UTW53899.1 ABC transporter substrate-binding protein [Kordiimonas sp. SCSIO 12610]